MTRRLNSRVMPGWVLTSRFSRISRISRFSRILVAWLLLVGLVLAGTPMMCGTVLGAETAATPTPGQLSPITGAGLLVRVRDVARLVTNRPNQVMGIGLVVGLAGTGDSGGNGLTARMAANLLDRMGVSLAESQLRARNVAAVMVTAELPAFVRSGDRIDVTVSSLGDARSLQGGVLLQTPLSGADGQVYVVAQGSVSVGGFSAGAGAGGGSSGVQKNHPTVGRVPGGGLVEQEIPFTLGNDGQLEWILNRPDFGTASRLAASIDRAFRPGTAVAQDAATVKVMIPEPFLTNPVGFIAMVEELALEPARTAQVVINERTGTVVIGADVRVAPVAVAHGNLRVSIHPQVVEVPAAGTTAAGTDTATATAAAITPASPSVTVVPVGDQIQVNEESGALQLIEGQASLSELVSSLNALGATPRDLIAILQAIKSAGALYGELVVE